MNHPHTDAVRLRGVRFSYDNGSTWTLDGIDLTVSEGERVCVVGSNGSGKSTLARLVAGLSAPDAGEVELLGRVVRGVDGPDADAYRAARRGIGLVFQNPEDQIVSTVVADDVAFGPENLGVAPELIGPRVHDALGRVTMDRYAQANPDLLSGGQQQRVAIASALAMEPRMLVLDEPNAMLDVESRVRVMRAIAQAHRGGATIVHITHMMEETLPADRVVVVHRGRIVFEGTPAQLFDLPADRLDAWGVERPRDGKVVMRRTAKADAHLHGGTPHHGAAVCGGAIDATAPGASGKEATPIIDVRGLDFRFSEGAHAAVRTGAGPLTLRHIDLTVGEGEFLAVVGRSGSGKSTFARLLCALEQPTAGSVSVAGIDVTDRRRRHELRRTIGYVMQQPERQLFAETIGQDVRFGPLNFGCAPEQAEQLAGESLAALGIADLSERSPWDCSGGQQRLAAIAGVLACRPRVLVLDEPTASLDARGRARVMDLLRRLNRDGITIVMTTHDLDEAMLVDRVVRFEEGQLTAQGRPVDVLERVPAQEDADRADAASPVLASDASVPLAHAHGIPASAGTADTAVGPSHTDDTQEQPPTDLPPVVAPSPMLVSPLGRRDPRVKALTFLGLMFCMVLIVSPWQLAWGAALCLCMMALARIRPTTAFHRVRGFVAMFLFMGVFNLFFTPTGVELAHWGPLLVTDQGVWAAVLYSTRLIMMVLLGTTMLACTTPTSLTDGFAVLFAPLQRIGWHVGEVSLVMSTALRFVPVLAREARQIAEAQATRGGDVETGSPAKRLRAAMALITPMFVGTLRHATDFGIALEARSYEGGMGRTHWHALRVAWRDWLLVAGAVSWLVALVAIGMLA